ncbi:hypothetical protein AAVH_01056 [Aphelenchoides avenae]|nr:hypothetical protein AAVH_01056 [Aphelenchus avenae]
MSSSEVSPKAPSSLPSLFASRFNQLLSSLQMPLNNAKTAFEDGHPDRRRVSQVHADDTYVQFFASVNLP